jgi:hypothetical protein
MIALQLFAAACLLALGAAAAPPSAAQCDSAYRSALQRGDAASVSTLDACAIHYRTEQLIHALAVIHARKPSPAALGKVQQLLALRPSDALLLQAAAAVYRAGGHAIWAALTATQAAFVSNSQDGNAGDKLVSEAAARWDEVQEGGGGARLKAAASCCEGQHPSPSCSKHFADSVKFIAM